MDIMLSFMYADDALLRAKVEKWKCVRKLYMFW